MIWFGGLSIRQLVSFFCLTYVLGKSNIFTLLRITPSQKRIEDRGLRQLLENLKIFNSFFENLKSVKKRLRYDPAKEMLNLELR